MKSKLSSTAHTHEHSHDQGFDEYLDKIIVHVAEILNSGYRLFTTDASGLFDLYLSKIPTKDRQYHNCNACRHFFERFGGLVTINASGNTAVPIWSCEPPPYYKKAITAVYDQVYKAKVTGAFLSKTRVLGLPVTSKWTHYSITIPSSHVHTSKVQTPEQAMAEKLEDFKNVRRALGEVPEAALKAVLALLESEALYRGEKIIGPVKWLMERHTEASGEKNRQKRENLLWRALSTAPAGFCHPRSSVAWSLIEDITSGLSVEDAKRKFAAKMKADIYQRPQSAPTVGNIARAEELFRQLELAPALERRFARLEEIKTYWTPQGTKDRTATGLFSHLKTKGDKKGVPTDLGAVKDPSTWEKFRAKILEGAVKIEFQVPSYGGFHAIVTAVNPDAPTILRWDKEGQRNPVSTYTYHRGSFATQWGLVGGMWANVTGICEHPSHWNGPSDQANANVLILEGARDNAIRELALFPETFRSELHEVRSTIEAYSKGSKVQGYEDASACGYGVSKGLNIKLRVTNSENQTMVYTIDRLD